MPHNRAPSNPRVFPPQAPDGFGQRKIGFGFFGVDWKFRQSAKILLRAKRGEQPTHLNNDGVRLARGAPRGDPRGKADPGAALGTPEREPRDLPHLVSLSAPIEEEEEKKLTQSTSLSGSMFWQTSEELLRSIGRDVPNILRELHVVHHSLAFAFLL